MYACVAYAGGDIQCTQSEIMSVADAIVDQGLDKLGYEYVSHASPQFLRCVVYVPHPLVSCTLLLLAR